MMKKILLLILFLLFNSSAWATDWTSDGTCVLALTLEAGSGNPDDKSATNNTCTLGGGAAWASAHLPAAYSSYYIGFDGNNDEIACGSDGAIDNFTASGHTVTTWIYPDSDDDPSSGSGNYIWGKNTTNFCSFYTETTYQLRYNLYNTSQANWVTSYSVNNVVGVSAWYHVAVTHDGSVTATNVDIYVNGVEVTYSTQTDGSGTKRSDASNNLAVGNYSTSAFGETYNGDIDEFAIFTEEKDSTDINDIMDNGLYEAPVAGGNKSQAIIYMM